MRFLFQTGSFATKILKGLSHPTAWGGGGERGLGRLRVDEFLGFGLGDFSAAATRVECRGRVDVRLGRDGVGGDGVG